MRFFILFISLALMTLFSPAQQVYSFELENTDGELISYEDIKGSELTVIDFWATWCKPCINSIPKLVKLSEQFDNKRVAFIGISVDSPRNMAKVKPFIESIGVSYPVLLDLNQELYREFNLTSIPTLLIVNSENRVVAVHEGFAPGDEEKLLEEIKALLHE